MGDPQDRREYELHLTPLGADVAADLLQVVFARYNNILQRLPAEKRPIMLEALADAIEEEH